MTKPSTARRNEKNSEIRLKKLEFLMKIIEEETTRVYQWARLLVLGNAGGIGTSLVIYKDLQSKFSETSLRFAILLFVVGLFSAGAFLVYVNAGYDSARKKIKVFIFSRDDISPLQKQIEQIDNRALFFATLLTSIFCVISGAAAILLQAI